MLTESWSGAELSKWRCQKGLTLRQLARATGLHHTTLLRWEAEISKPSELARREFMREVRRVGLLSLRTTSVCTPRFVPTSSDYLTAYRQAARITQTKLARKLGVTQSTLSKWEGGDLAMPEHLIPQAAATLGLSESSAKLWQDTRTDWGGLSQASALDCYASYLEYWNTCGLQQNPTQRIWELALERRLDDLSVDDHDAQRILTWFYATQSYISLVQHKPRQVFEIARKGLPLARKVGFDFTSGYLVWALARTFIHHQSSSGSLMMVRKLASVNGCALDRGLTPYRKLVSETERFLLGMEPTESSFQPEKIVHRMDEGHLCRLGDDYWRECFATYPVMLDLAAHRWREAENKLDRLPVFTNPIASMLAKTYRFTARRETTGSDFEKDAISLAKVKPDLKFALKSIKRHLVVLTSDD